MNGSKSNELLFEVSQEDDGGFTAECLTENIYTQADTWVELRKNVLEAVKAYFFDGTMPALIRLHLIKDEILTAA
jgi:hypothetical protein